MVNGIGTDAMAVACILGSAALAGAVTVAAMAGGKKDVVSAVETRVRIEEARHRIEHSRIRIEESRTHLHRLDLREIDLRELRLRDLEPEPALEGLDRRIEAEIERELERLEEELSRLPGR